MREILGEIAGNSKGALPAALITQFRELPPYKIKLSAKCLYMCIDPSGGGAGEMGVCVYADYAGYFVIVCLASVSIKGKRSNLKEKEAVLALIAKLRSNTFFSVCPLIMAVECAPSIAAAHIYTYVEAEPALCYMFEGAGGKEGVPKSNESTHIMKDEFEALMQENRVRFSADLVTFGERTPDEEKRKLIKQMQNLRYEPIGKQNDPTEPQKYKITAKSGSDQDDLIVSVLMGPFWKRRFWSSKKPIYGETKRRIRERLHPDDE